MLKSVQLVCISNFHRTSSNVHIQEVSEYLQRNMKNSKLFGVAPSSQITTVAEYTFLKQPVVGQL